MPDSGGLPPPMLSDPGGVGRWCTCMPDSGGEGVGGAVFSVMTCMHLGCSTLLFLFGFARCNRGRCRSESFETYSHCTRNFSTSVSSVWQMYAQTRCACPSPQWFAESGGEERGGAGLPRQSVVAGWPAASRAMPPPTLLAVADSGGRAGGREGGAHPLTLLPDSRGRVVSWLPHPLTGVGPHCTWICLACPPEKAGQVSYTLPLSL